MRRNGLAGLAAADYLEGQVTIRPAGRPDTAPAPVQPQPQPELKPESEPEPVTRPRNPRRNQSL